MAIRHVSLLPQTASAGAPGEGDQTPVSVVPRILSSLDAGYHGFTRASQLYNSAFFEGEALEFKEALVLQLKELYPNFTNSYWDKVALDAHQRGIQ